MSLRTWFRPSHRLLALFLVITLAPSALLLAFGWRLLAQERELQARQVEERRQQAADLVVSVLEQTLVATEQGLRDDRTIQRLANTADAVAVVFRRDGIDAFPRGRLLYYPRPMSGVEAPSHVFETGEALELRAHDAVKAAAWFRHVAQSDNPAVRAGALIRLARNLRKSNQSDLALRPIRKRPPWTVAVQSLDIATDSVARRSRDSWFHCSGHTRHEVGRRARNCPEYSGGQHPSDGVALVR